MAISNLLALGLWDPILGGYLSVWHIPVIIILVVLIIFWIQYRKKQM